MQNEPTFITRKRKKWKFGHFNQWSNCFRAETVTPKTWHEFFKTDQPLTLELGAGTADLSVAFSQARRADNFVAVDVKSDRLYTGAKFCREQSITNCAFLRAHAGQLPTVFNPGSIKRVMDNVS